MIRKIIKIDEEKCNGCGLCVTACHEGAIGLVDGKAKLLRDDYCDGLGNCLPTCPTGAINFEEREAAEYNEAEVKKNAAKPAAPACGCPGTQSREIKHAASAQETAELPAASQLNQWPVQIKLAPVNAPYFNNANLLIAADCTAYAYGSFHSRFMKNRITLIGCPKLDEGDYAEKLTEILKRNSIKSVTVVRMEVPCCGGIENAVMTALKNCGRLIQWQSVTISTDGRILEN
ncbi:ATP-binding protein [Acetanaerobacterium elongatum]|uniref:4Fe-4S binding domain-containing protein n=1 Tax=Acetanaerobacterium elongatum TaxID=258515 RepID=A0A1H0AIF1_9FIRM|nr:4Fe-4S binding protein [Acetanaerobacterium elongatum]SDN33388.1 4Fe-4S binding domain-containing protein [Acetanaerobacterium elongatum]